MKKLATKEELLEQCDILEQQIAFYAKLAYRMSSTHAQMEPEALWIRAFTCGITSQSEHLLATVKQWKKLHDEISKMD